MDILLVEDNKVTQWILKHNLKELGFDNVDVASDGAEAIHLFSKRRYTLVLLDISLPKISGIDVARMMRDTGLPFTNIVGIPHCADEVKVNCMKAGCDAVYDKPITTDELAFIVNRWTKTRRVVN